MLKRRLGIDDPDVPVLGLRSLCAVVALSAVLGHPLVAQSRAPAAPGQTGTGSSCGPNPSYAESGDCSKLDAYRAAGGNDSVCLDWWSRALEIDRQIEALSSPRTENQDRSVSQRQGSLAQELAKLEHQIDMNCWPIPVGVPDKCPGWVKPAIDQLVDLLRFGPDFPQWELLRARYAADLAARELFKLQLRILLSTPKSQAPPDLEQQIRSKKADLDLNLQDLENIRRDARALLTKSAKDNPGIVPDNGIEILLNCEFSPVGQR